MESLSNSIDLSHSAERPSRMVIYIINLLSINKSTQILRLRSPRENTALARLTTLWEILHGSRDTSVENYEDESTEHDK